MNRKLTDQDVRDIRASTLPTSELACIYGRHRGTILSCRRMESYTHIADKGATYQFRSGSLTEQQVIEIRSGRKSINVLAKEFGVDKSNIKFARNGTHYKKTSGYTYTENYRPRSLTRKKIRMIKYYLGRGYLNYGQLEKHFKVSRQTVFKLNEYGKRPEGKRPKFNGISYAYIKALFQIYENYREVAEAINEKPNTIYGLLTKERLSINYVR